MKRITRPLMAAGLIAAGVLGDHALASASPTPSVTAAAISTSTAAITNLDTTVQRAFAVASPSVVYIKSTGVGSGSGIVYDTSGNIVTNAHVVAGATLIAVTLNTGKTYTALLVGTDTADDLAVIHINASGLTAAHFAATGATKVAETVLAIGSPLGLQETVTSGLISALHRTVQESNGAYLPDAVQTSAPINPGNSGGALVDLSGAVVGIPTLQATDAQNNNGGAAQGIGFAISSDRVTVIAHQLIATGTVAHTGRAYLGLSAVTAATQASLASGQGTTTTEDYGAMVRQVAAGSPAEKAGIQQSDVITALGGSAISSEDDLLAALATEKPGKTIAITLARGGTTLIVQVHLTELPAA